MSHLVLLCKGGHLNNNTVADAILDRLVHSSHRIELEGGSMRRIKSTIKKVEEN